MLGIDRRNAGTRAVESGAGPDVFGVKRRSGIPGAESGRGVQLGESDFAPAGSPGIEAKRAGIGAALPGEDGGIEPGPDRASDHGVSEWRGGEGQAVKIR